MRGGAYVAGRFRFEWKIRNKQSGQFEHFIDEEDNLVPVGGLNWLLNTSVGSREGATAGTLTAWVGLKAGAGLPDSADVYGTYTNAWQDISSTSDGSKRQKYMPAAASAGQITNSASKAVFAMTSAWVVTGAYLINSYTGPHLIAASAINSSRTVDSGDTINVTYTLTASNQ